MDVMGSNGVVLPGPETGDGPMALGVPTGFRGMLSEGVPGKLHPPPMSDRPMDELVIRGDDRSGNGDEGIFMLGPAPDMLLDGNEAGPCPVIREPALF